MRIACVQSNVVFGDPLANARHAIKELRLLKTKGVELALFPEAFLTGYCVDSQTEACAIAIPRDHDATQLLQKSSEELDMLVVVGFAEADGDHIRNTAVLLEPGRPNRFYWKTHLPFLGLDRFVTRGEELPLYDTRLGKIGILICYDQRPPEPTRSLALRGADIILLPTNWPIGAEVSADHISIARAAENRVFIATCNRVGVEQGFTFIGCSKIISPVGKVLAFAAGQAETLIADLDLPQARIKRTVNIPGKYEIDLFGTRNSALYSDLTDPK